MTQPATHSEINRVVRRMGLSCDWHKDIEGELRQCQEQSTDIIDDTNRENLSHPPFVTIDGTDAKDFDDAIYCSENGEGTVLWVAIADVASHVRVGSALDREAFKRGNSTYLPGRVLPMLPPLLSEDLCSLLPGKERPVIACRMVFNKQARMTTYRFSKALIRSQCRLSYQQVHAFSEGNSLAGCDSSKVRSMLRTALKLYRTLRRSRKKRGALDLDIPRKRLCFDKKHRIEKVITSERNDAHCMIEEFMVCANVAAAHYLASRKLYFLSRVHEGIKDEAFPTLDKFLRSSGLHLSGTKVSDLARLIEQTADRTDKQIIHTIILSSLQRAIYAPSLQGHFGLALKHYSHFTSPIRRYADLSVHRAIHTSLDSKAGHLYSLDELKSQGQHCTATERRSDETVWDIERYFLCVLAQSEVGRVHTGIITAVVHFGLFVELTALKTDGLLHVKSLGNDYYEFNDTQQCLKGARHGKVYKVGETIDVTIRSVRPDKRKIDLAPVRSGSCN